MKKGRKNKLNDFKKELLEIRKKLAGEVEKSRDYSHEEGEGDMSDITDDAVRTYSQQIILQLGEREREQIKEIDEALERIDNGEYGICVECGEEIPEKRLKLIPYAKCCITCKEKIEVRNKL